MSSFLASLVCAAPREAASEAADAQNTCRCRAHHLLTGCATTPTTPTPHNTHRPLRTTRIALSTLPLAADWRRCLLLATPVHAHMSEPIVFTLGGEEDGGKPKSALEEEREKHKTRCVLGWRAVSTGGGRGGTSSRCSTSTHACRHHHRHNTNQPHPCSGLSALARSTPTRRRCHSSCRRRGASASSGRASPRASTFSARCVGGGGGGGGLFSCCS